MYRIEKVIDVCCSGKYILYPFFITLIEYGSESFIDARDRRSMIAILCSFIHGYRVAFSLISVKDREKASFFFHEKSYNPSMQSLFEKDITPLASLLRPESLDDLVGQSHLVGEGKPIRKFIEAGRLPSILLW